MKAVWYERAGPAPEVLTYLSPSRYCQSDRLGGTTSRRASAICSDSSGSISVASIEYQPSSSSTDSGRAVMDQLITQQAAIIAYANDFKLLMYLTLATIPLATPATAPVRSAVTARTSTSASGSSRIPSSRAPYTLK